MPRSNRPRSGGRPRSGNSRSGNSRSGNSRSGNSRSGDDPRSGGHPRLDVGRATAGGRRTEQYRGATWLVSPVSGPRAGKPYRCPGCDQEIPPGVPHVVVWPHDGPVGVAGGVAERRHWHTPCWSARERRGSRG